MSHATLDRVLALLVLGIVTTGLLSLKAGRPDAGWVFTVHGLLGGALLAAVAWKLRRSVPRAVVGRRWRRLGLALGVTLLAVGALMGGFLWVAAGEPLTVGSWTVLTLHAWLGLILVPLVAFHLLPRRWRVITIPPRNGISRRTLLATGGLAIAGVAAFGVTSFVDRLRGGTRRFTGSRWLPSGGIPPSTTFFGEGVPSIDHGAWRLTVIGHDGRSRSLALGELRALGEVDMTAVLDCTSGWALETIWRGVPLARLLTIPARGSIQVRSVTGWSTILSADEAASALLATGVAGGPLPTANGAPCRLVVPGRRGLDWVKWVDEVSLV
jgi:molybdopterin-dependent oxidoreductase-like protein protein